MNLHTIGIDLSKTTFHIVGLDENGLCQVGRAVDVLDRDAWLLSSRFRLLSRSAKPRRIAIARFGDSANSANGGLLEKDSGRHRGGRETVVLGQQN